MLTAAKTLPAALFLFMWSTTPPIPLNASDEALNRLKTKNAPYPHRQDASKNLFNMSKPINTTIQLPHMSVNGDHKGQIELTLLRCTIGNFGLLSKSSCPLNTDGFASTFTDQLHSTIGNSDTCLRLLLAVATPLPS